MPHWPTGTRPTGAGADTDCLEGRQKRLVDELHILNAVSGGSFPALYCALYGGRIVQDFETRFLRKDWEPELRARIFRSPSNWFRLWSPYFGRAHIFAELLDKALFDGHTFRDLVARHQRPLVSLHTPEAAPDMRDDAHTVAPGA